jgi:hypothetical protein
MFELPHRGLVTGAVELHHQASDWLHHGHHLDPRYNDVVLHVVSKLDLEETRRVDGSLVPVAILAVPDEMLFRIDARLPEIWSSLGGEVCAAGLSESEPHRVVRVLQRLGDQRLAERVTRIEGDLATRSPREILTTLLLDALGFSENRHPMQDLAELLNVCNWASRMTAQPAAGRERYALAMLFGLAGYLPLSPSDAHLSGLTPGEVSQIELLWQKELAASIALDAIAPTAWVRARTRPANHPAARLAIAARVLASLAEDPVSEMLDVLASGHDPVAWLQSMTAHHPPALGASRATAIVATSVIPMAIAVARRDGHFDLEEAAANAWERLRASESPRPAKRAMRQVAGTHRLRGLAERGNHGLIKLDRDFCTPRRCFECPIAAEVVRSELSDVTQERLDP